jgi:hypothetical protein
MAPESTQEEQIDRAALRSFAHRLDALGWGAFFIWLGIVFMTEIRSGVALLGIGIIIWGGQLARLAFRLSLEPFWAVVGTGFLLGGGWQLVETQMSLGPILLILAGVAVILTALLRKHHCPGVWGCCDPSAHRGEGVTHKKA